MSPVFLTTDEVLELHRESIDRYGGSHEIRDPGLLNSALAMPGASFGGNYLHPNLASMAGALLFHLVQNHAFVDGNKRIGAIAARVFLMLNGATFDPELDEYEKLVLAVARGELSKEQTIAFFTERTKI
jgi:death-on-curing protein